MGNICRSPTGEGIFRKMIDDQELTDFVRIDSAGTIGYHAGKPADFRMRQAAAAKGYRLDSESRQVTVDDFVEFDLIIAMDRENLSDLKSLRRQVTEENIAELKLLSDFLGDQWPTDVPDPYYGGEDGFQYVVEMIEDACPAILVSLNLETSD